LLSGCMSKGRRENEWFQAIVRTHIRSCAREFVLTAFPLRREMVTSGKSRQFKGVSAICDVENGYEKGCEKGASFSFCHPQQLLSNPVLLTQWPSSVARLPEPLVEFLMKPPVLRSGSQYERAWTKEGRLVLETTLLMQFEMRMRMLGGSGWNGVARRARPLIRKKPCCVWLGSLRYLLAQA